jgi:integrase
MTGHIRRRGERSWELKFDVGTDPATGKRLTRYNSFRGTKREAETELVKLKAAADRGELLEPTKLSMSEFLARWERDWASVHLSPKTTERYQEIVRRHINPHLGAIPIQRLRPVNLSELYAKLLREGRGAERGLSARSVGHVHRLLHRAMGHAAQWGILQSNPVSLVSPPRADLAEVEILDANQVRAVLRALKGKTLYPIVVTALATGMRRGELLALRWRDVDLDRGILRVEQSLEQTKAGLRFKAPKTKCGRRTISLPPSLVATLRAQWKAQQEQRLALGLGKAPEDGLVFATFDGRPRSPNALTKKWSVAAKALGLRTSFHALRHSHASHLIAANMDVLAISRRLGHSTPTITLSVYGHLFANSDARAAEAIEAAFSFGTD